MGDLEETICAEERLRARRWLSIGCVGKCCRCSVMRAVNVLVVDVGADLADLWQCGRGCGRFTRVAAKRNTSHSHLHRSLVDDVDSKQTH